MFLYIEECFGFWRESRHVMKLQMQMLRKIKEISLNRTWDDL